MANRVLSDSAACELAIAAAVDSLSVLLIGANYVDQQHPLWISCLCVRVDLFAKVAAAS